MSRATSRPAVLTTILTTTLTAVVTAVTVAPASAAGTRWHTIESIYGARHQVCKKPSGDGAAWVVRNRNDARQAEDVTRARMVAVHRGRTTTRRWASGPVSPGNVSEAGSVRVPRGAPGWKVRYSLSGPNAGGGGESFLSAIGRC